MNERIANQVGRNIRDIRIKKGLTQRALADLSHSEFVYIQDVESGHLGVTLVKAYRIAGVLGCPVSELFRDLGV